MSIRSAITVTRDTPAFLVLLGFADDHDDRGPAGQRLAEMSAACPLAGITLALALAAACVATSFALQTLVLAVAALLAFAGLALSAGTRLDWLPYQRARGAAVGAGLLALVTLLTLEGIRIEEADGMIPLGAAMLLIGAIGLVGLAVQPVRGVTLVFGAGLVVAMAVMLGAALVWFEALALLAALAVAMVRLGHLDRRGTVEMAEEAERGRRAARPDADRDFPDGRRGSRHRRHRAHAGVPPLVAYLLLRLSGLRGGR